MISFEEALRSKLESDPELTRKGRRILNILNARPSRRRTRQIKRLEEHARIHLGVGNQAEIDWIDLLSIGSAFLTLLKFLLVILAFI